METTLAYRREHPDAFAYNILSREFPLQFTKAWKNRQLPCDDGARRAPQLEPAPRTRLQSLDDPGLTNSYVC